MTRSRIKELRHVRASELLENPKNWRRHPQFQVDALRGALERIGYADALIAREVDGKLMLLDGHLRAATTPDDEVPVLIVDLDEAEADFLLATLDPLAALARTDGELLKQLTESLALEKGVLDKMLAQTLAGVRSIEADTNQPENAFGTLETRAQLGDLWSLGEHRLLVGDSTDRAQVERLMQGKRAQLIVTDPPYGVDYIAKARDMNRLGYVHSRAKRGSAIEGDMLDDDSSVELWRDAFSIAREVANRAAWYVWHAPGRATRLMLTVLNDLDVLHHQTLIWVKNNFAIGRCDYQWIHEPCFYGWIKSDRPAFRGSMNQTTVWQIDRDTARPDHPTQKPLELYVRPILNHLISGEIVFDPFAGSAPAIIAAERTKTRAYCVEIDPARADVALRRWEAETGREAQLVNRSNTCEEVIETREVTSAAGS